MEAVEYLPKTFGVGNDNGAIYQGGPSASVDEAWLNLYNCTSICYSHDDFI